MVSELRTSLLTSLYYFLFLAKQAKLLCNVNHYLVLPCVMGKNQGCPRETSRQTQTHRHHMNSTSLSPLLPSQLQLPCSPLTTYSSLHHTSRPSRMAMGPSKHLEELERFRVAWLFRRVETDAPSICSVGLPLHVKLPPLSSPSSSRVLPVP